MPLYDTYNYDVLVIGAGGAGLRAAIEACAHGVSVGLVCKSLLGKAHTVMAEGGMAAAMGGLLVWRFGGNVVKLARLEPPKTVVARHVRRAREAAHAGAA